MIDFVKTYFIYFLIFSSIAEITTKSILKKKGFPIRILNNEINEIKNLFSLIKIEQDFLTKKLFQILLGLYVFIIVSFIGWMILFAFIVFIEA